MWLLMAFATITITSCKSSSTSKPDKEEPVDTVSMKQAAQVQKPDTALETTRVQQSAIKDKNLSSVEQMNTFALQLFLQIHKTSERMQNIVVSPLSVAY